MDAEQRISEGLAALQGLAPAGFAIALHVQFTTPTFLFQTYPRSWIEEYSRRGFVMHDPTVAWAFDNLGVIDWSDLEPRDSQGVLAKAREHGLVNGFTYSLMEGDSRSLSSFSKTDAAFSDDEITSICAIVDDIHGQTAGLSPLSAETRDKLVGLSIRVTHPGPSG